ncbi:membrane protein [Arenibacter palladensis]|uniref:Membrane protein n=1 Tax=Arenibacter palladensis TaxID=237373 RepID=A0A1M5FEG2_9FLAO|nr:YihY/virulence factor BrkB family protein [Arenibacter palladensis]MDO6604720.1 YihY/virulence factor BrkB family protein [Arenibacter palladensis]SHF89491.1 membrane protein [Arenibacter palladensis]|tara:strand:- start:5143 stop:6129 length:987 start_codon:yes stop_codon:yes gene_type:complete
MSQEIESKLEKIPIVNWIVGLMKSLKLPGFEGLSIYDLMEMYALGIVKGALSTRASSISFSLFLALFPLLIFLVTLIPFIIPYVSVGNSNFDTEFLIFLESFLPRATGDYFSEIYLQISAQERGDVLSSAIAFITSIFLMANGVNAIFVGFENSYHVNLNRSIFKQYVYALMVGLMLSVLLLLGAVIFVYFEAYVLIGLHDITHRGMELEVDKSEFILVQWGKFLFLGLLAYFITAILYYFGTKEGRQARFFSAGALMTTLLFILTSYLFGVYVEKFARYNELYGALGGLLILLVFIWLNSNILLLGFELNASLNSLRKQYEKHDGKE